MVRRIKEDVREIQGGFPERVVRRIPIEDLPEDAPELLLSRLLDEYRGLREERLKNAPARARAAAGLLVVGLQQKLLSSIEAFAISLARHRTTVRKQWERAMSGEAAASGDGDALASARSFASPPDADDERAGAFRRRSRSGGSHTDRSHQRRRRGPGDRGRADGSDPAQGGGPSRPDAGDGVSRPRSPRRQDALLDRVDPRQPVSGPAPLRRASFPGAASWERGRPARNGPKARNPGGVLAEGPRLQRRHINAGPSLHDESPTASPPRWNERRVLVFTENVIGTKRYLREMLEQAIEGTDLADERIETIDGQTVGAKRKEIQRRFNADPASDPLRILLATDAAREGLNFQAHCTDLFHFDLPWNPGRIEQRNGRIDRKLQPAAMVVCHYFVLPQRHGGPRAGCAGEEDRDHQARARQPLQGDRRRHRATPSGRHPPSGCEPPCAGDRSGGSGSGEEARGGRGA